MQQNLNLRFCWSIAMTDHPYRYSYSPDCKVSARQICDQVEKRKVAPICTDVSVFFVWESKAQLHAKDHLSSFQDYRRQCDYSPKETCTEEPQKYCYKVCACKLCEPLCIILATVLNLLFPGGSQGAGGDLRQASDTCFVVERPEMNHTMMLLDNIRWRNISWKNLKACIWIKWKIQNDVIYFLRQG